MISLQGVSESGREATLTRRGDLAKLEGRSEMDLVEGRYKLTSHSANAAIDVERMKRSKSRGEFSLTSSPC